MSDSGAYQQEDILARMRRSNAETKKLIEEALELRAEEAKLRAEERKPGREAFLAPLAIFFTAVSATGASIISIVTLLPAHS